MMRKKIILGIVLILVIGLGSFWLGTKRNIRYSFRVTPGERTNVIISWNFHAFGKIKEISASSLVLENAGETLNLILAPQLLISKYLTKEEQEIALKELPENSLIPTTRILSLSDLKLGDTVTAVASFDKEVGKYLVYSITVLPVISQ